MQQATPQPFKELWTMGGQSPGGWTEWGGLIPKSFFIWGYFNSVM
jgi:hypothetical protein